MTTRIDQYLALIQEIAAKMGLKPHELAPALGGAFIHACDQDGVDPVLAIQECQAARKAARKAAQ